MSTDFGDAGINGPYTFSLGTIWNKGIFTCPGTGNQYVDYLKVYMHDVGDGPNVLLAIYNEAGNVLICSGVTQLALSGTLSWQGHLTRVSMSPNPCQLVGGTNYKLAVSLDNNAEGGADPTQQSYSAAVDYTDDGFPGSLPAYDNQGYEVCIVCGVTPVSATYTKTLTALVATTATFSMGRFYVKTLTALVTTTAAFTHLLVHLYTKTLTAVVTTTASFSRSFMKYLVALLRFH